MRLFFELSKLAFQRQMSYRAATIAGLVTNFFFGLLRAAVLIALYNQRVEVAGFTLADAITYTALTQASIGFLSMFYWYDMMRSVYTGDISSDLLKPMDYYRYWLAQDLGRAFAAFLTRGITIFLAYELVVDLVYPDNVIQWGVLGVSLLLALLISFSWRFLVNLTAFWIPNAIGIGRFFFFGSLFFSGFLMPLAFYPDWVVKIAYATPFPHTVNTLVEFYLGKLTGIEALAALTIQLVWVLVLFGLGQILLRRGVRRLVILGG